MKDYRTTKQKIQDEIDYIDPRPPTDVRSREFTRMMRGLNISEREQLQDWIRWLDEGLDFDAFKVHVKNRLDQGISTAARFLYIMDEDAL
jgi:hypothetical protein